MIKRTLYFGNPAYLKIKEEQLIFEKKYIDEIKNIFLEKYLSAYHNGDI